MGQVSCGFLDREDNAGRVTNLGYGQFSRATKTNKQTNKQKLSG
jgi:UDP:flavonoid glycosyltransferase YjiC (YdhE family)